MPAVDSLWGGAARTKLAALELVELEPQLRPKLPLHAQQLPACAVPVLRRFRPHKITRGTLVPAVVATAADCPLADVAVATACTHPAAVRVRRGLRGLRERSRGPPQAVQNRANRTPPKSS